MIIIVAVPAAVVFACGNDVAVEAIVLILFFVPQRQ